MSKDQVLAAPITEGERQAVQALMSPIKYVEHPVVTEVQVGTPPEDVSHWLIRCERLASQPGPWGLYWLPQPQCGLWFGYACAPGSTLVVRSQLYIFSSAPSTQRIPTADWPFGVGCIAHIAAFPVFFQRGANAINGFMPLTESDRDPGVSAMHCHEQLAAAHDDIERIALMLRVLRGRIANVESCDEPASAMVSLIQTDPGTDGIEGLLASLGISPRHFNRYMHRYLGMTPKRYTRYRRFNRALSLLLKDVDRPLTDIAMETGFFDHAHFTRECKVFTGFSPRQLLQQPGALDSLPHGVLVRHEPNALTKNT